MSTWDGNNFYFSGQGVVLVGERDSNGKPKNLVPVGNVSALSIAIETTALEHKESQTGSRGIDLRLTTETKATLTMNMENFIGDNLKIALRGTSTEEAASSVTGEALPYGIPGAIAPLERIKVSSVVIDNPAGNPLTLYTNDQTAFDYKLNADSGSIQLNDGSIQPFDQITTGGSEATGVAVGDPTTITVTGHTAAVGDYFVGSGFAGADAALVENLPFKIIAIAGDVLSLDVDTTGKDITSTTVVSYISSEGLVADYSYAAQNLVDALTEGSQERYLRFEGLNTADENRPVVVEVFKFATDPLQELALIGDEVQNFQLVGNVLADPLQATGSKFFKQRLLR